MKEKVKTRRKKEAKQMVAISLYRGDLRRVPDVPRRWLMPVHPLSVKNFKSLLSRRSKSLSLLRSTTTTTATTTSTNPSPNQHEQRLIEEGEKGIENCQPLLLETAKILCSDVDVIREGKDDDQVKRLDGDVKRVPGFEPVVVNNVSNSVDIGNSEEKIAAELQCPNLEINDKDGPLDEKETRKIEVEDKLKVLNERKHNLVQMLKQILNVEEELRRRNSVQTLATRPSVSLQVDVTNDSSLMTRYNSPRVGSEGNFSGDAEGGESDDVSNHNIYSRRTFQMSSPSPSSVSPFRRPMHIQQNAGPPHPSRAPLGTSGSPSRFSPIGLQGQPGNSGTNSMMSFPSPAASGGTSVFRETRHPSSWN